MKTVHLPVNRDYWSLVKYEASRLEMTVPKFVIRCIDKYFDEPDDKDNQLIHPMPKDRQG